MSNKPEQIDGWQVLEVSPNYYGLVDPGGVAHNIRAESMDEVKKYMAEHFKQKLSELLL